MRGNRPHICAVQGVGSGSEAGLPASGPPRSKSWPGGCAGGGDECCGWGDGEGAGVDTGAAVGAGVGVGSGAASAGSAFAAGFATAARAALLAAFAFWCFFFAACLPAACFAGFEAAGLATTAAFAA